MSKRKIKKRVKLFFCLILVLVIAFFGYKVYLKFQSNEQAKPNEPEKPVEVWPKVYTANLVATGDTLVHSPILREGYNSQTDSYDFNYIFRLVEDIIPQYDIAYYNQESVFGGKEYTFSGSASAFNTPSEFGDAMINLGFNLVSLASNHSADCRGHAKNCIVNSYNYWKEQNVTFDGFNEDETMENHYNISEVNGITYGFLNYTNYLNGLDGHLSGNKYLVDIYDEERVKEEVTALRDKVDVLIVAMHWHKASPEYSFVPTDANKKIARYLDSLGVDLILGTYSHCVQPYERLENGALVFYSLGNFLSNQIALNDIKLNNGNYKYHPYVGTIGMLVNMTITKTVYEDGTKEIKIDNLGGDLLYSYRKSSGNGYLVVPFSKMTTEYNKNYQKLYDEYTNYVLRYDKDIIFKEAGVDA